MHLLVDVQSFRARLCLHHRTRSRQGNPNLRLQGHDFRHRHPRRGESRSRSWCRRRRQCVPGVNAHPRQLLFVVEDKPQNILLGRLSLDQPG